jgi:tetratricopeptide (TPR) repeat protein
VGLFDLFRRAPAAASSPAAISATHNTRAIAAIRRGDREGAVAELVIALEVDPRSAAAIVTIGNLLLEDGALEDAIAHYEFAVRIDDAYATAYHNLGVALRRSGRIDESVRMLRKATRLEARMKR